MKQSFDEILNRLVRRLSAEYDINAPPEAPQARFSSFPLHCEPELCTFPCLSLSVPSSSYSPYNFPSPKSQYHHHRGDGEGDEEPELVEQQPHPLMHHPLNHHTYGATKRLSQPQHDHILFLLSRKTNYRQNQHSLPLASYSILRNIVNTFGKLLEYQIQRMIYNIMVSTSSEEEEEGEASEEDKEILRKFTDLPLAMGNHHHHNNRSSSKSSSLVIPELVYTNFSTMLPMEHWQEEEMGCDNVSLRLMFHAELTLRIVPNDTVHTAYIRAPGFTHGVFTSHLNHFRSHNNNSNNNTNHNATTPATTAGNVNGTLNTNTNGNGNGNVRYGGVGVGIGSTVNTSRGNHNRRPESIDVDINTKALYNSIRRECKVISKKVVNAIVGFELKKLKKDLPQQNHVHTHANVHTHTHTRGHATHNYHQLPHLPLPTSTHQPKAHKHQHGNGHRHHQHHHHQHFHQQQYHHHHPHHKHSATMNSDGVATYKTEKTAVSTVVCGLDGCYDEPTNSSGSGSGTMNMDLGSSDVVVAAVPSDETPKKKTSRRSSSSSASVSASTTTMKYHDPQYLNHNTIASYQNEYPLPSQGGSSGLGSDIKSIGSGSISVEGSGGGMSNMNMITPVFYDQEDLRAGVMMGYSNSNSNSNNTSDDGEDSGGNNNTISIIYEQERASNSKKKTKRKNWKRLISPQKEKVVVDKTHTDNHNHRPIVAEQTSEDDSIEKKSKKKNDHRWKALFTSSKQ